jgi:peptidoglycan/xylan/chitin deacetylase (PgdA/CDA1 family)
MQQEQTGKNDRSREVTPQKIKVLVYHRVVNDDRLSHEYPWVCVHAREFRNQLELLDRWGFTAVTFDDIRLCLAGQLDLPRRPVVLTFDDGYLDMYENAFPLLCEYGMRAVVFALGDTRIKTSEWCRSIGSPVAALMGGQQLVELHAAGFEIGSHSMTHANLTILPGGEAWEEISRSRILLEILLDSPVLSFSYPYGLANVATRRMVADAGYSIACGISTGPARFGKEKYDNRRIAIPNSASPVGFAMRMLAPFEYYLWFRSRVEERFSRNRKNGRSRSTNHLRKKQEILGSVVDAGDEEK